MISCQIDSRYDGIFLRLEGGNLDADDRGGKLLRRILQSLGAGQDVRCRRMTDQVLDWKEGFIDDPDIPKTG